MIQGWCKKLVLQHPPLIFEKIASSGQPCVITIRYKNEKYSYPIRLFDKSKIEQLITDLNDISDKKISHSEVIDSSIFDFSKKNTIKNFASPIS